MEVFSNQASSQDCFITISVYLSLSHVLKLILFKFDLLLKMGTTSYRDVDRFWLFFFFWKMWKKIMLNWICCNLNLKL